MSIKTFSCKQTAKIWERKFSKILPQEIQVLARRKLKMIHSSEALDDLSTPPSNQLERFYGKKKLKKYSIRINKQWRICFHFEDGNAFDVEIVDYH